jgi:radical SAM protein with 4Fe4S-binding SPASM domain
VELSTAEGKRLLEQIAAVDRFRMVVITGGEPLLRNDIFELVEHAGRLGLRIVFSTNGTLLSPDAARDLARLGVVKFSISLDGFTRERHESIRRKAGCFQGALDGISAAARTGVCLQINFTAMRPNLSELPGALDLAESLRADIIMVFQTIPPRLEGEGLGLDAEEQLQLIRIIAEKQKSARALIMPVACPEYWPWLVQRRPFFHGGVSGRLLAGCGAGSGFVYVRADGDVWPCNFIPVAAGNVRRGTFADIWYDSTLLREFRDRRRLKGACGACHERDICGGCRGRAFARTADPLAADPNCFLNSENENYKKPARPPG